jgi:catechol 2,3-dioxygenase-like lactoylglutathione lyase family enzyme
MADLKLELVLIPVSDVDRAKAFYTEQLGFELDVDHEPNEDFRVVQLTPPGSACSVTIGKGITSAEPGAYRGTHLVVEDIEAAREELVGRGVEVGAIRRRRDGSTASTRITPTTTRSPTSPTRTAIPGCSRRCGAPTDRDFNRRGAASRRPDRAPRGRRA